MAVKLKSVLQSRLLLLALKPLIFAGLLFLIWWWNFSIFSVGFFLAGIFLLYIYPLMNSLIFSVSLVILISLAFNSLFIVFNHFWMVFLTIIACTFLFFLILGLKNLYLTKKIYWYFLLNLSLFYGLFSNYFIKIDDYFLIKLFLVFLASFFLFREFLKIFTQAVSRENNLLSFILALLTSQLAWIVSWLPIGPIAGANLLFIFIYLAENLIILRTEGKLKDKRAIFKNIIIFCLLLLIIIITSQWQISF
ncbi:MAG: hypothetical protein AAB847_01590 [Patescibacteria group bacterium]